MGIKLYLLGEKYILTFTHLAARGIKQFNLLHECIFTFFARRKKSYCKLRSIRKEKKLKKSVGLSNALNKPITNLFHITLHEEWNLRKHPLRS